MVAMLHVQPPPVPQLKPSAGGRDAVSASDYERTLATELAALLTKRNDAPGTPQGLAAVLANDDAQDFDWIDADAPNVLKSPAAKEPASAAWVQRARRERRFERLRHGAAWVVTMLIGGAVLVVAAYLMLGRAPDLAILEILRDELFL